MSEYEDLPLHHPDHNVAAGILQRAIVDSPNDMIQSVGSHFASLPHGHRHRVAGVYANKYMESARAGDELAAASHRHRDYAAAASQLDRSNEEFAGMHDMMAYNMGGEHPLVKTMRSFVESRRDMASSYKKTLGLHNADTDQRFKEITGNLNIGQQFK